MGDDRVTLRSSLAPGDRDALARILEATGVFRPEEIAVALELVDEGLGDNPDEYFFAIAEGAGGEVLGYACWGHAPMTDAVFDLYWIAVDPTRHGRGVGQALLAACEADVRARGGRMLLIETEGTEAYEPTRRFYLRAGYPEVARVADYYRIGADKIVYGRRLLPRPAAPGG